MILFMKRILMIFACFLFTFVFNDKVYAVIDTTTMEIECIYATGISVSLTYDSTNNKLNANIKEYPITKSVTIEGETLSTSSLFTCDGACQNENVNHLKGLTCPSEIRVWKISKAHLDQDTNEWRNDVSAVYSFKYYYNNNTSNSITDYYGGQEGTDNKTGWWIFGEGATYRSRVIALTSNSPLSSSDSPSERIPLVAERLYIRGSLDSTDYSVSYKSASQEVVGNNSYIQFFKKGAVADRQYYVKKGRTMTSISNVDDDLIIGNDYICFKESVMEQDSSRVDSSYKVNSIYHRISRATKGKDEDGKDIYTCSGEGYVLYKLDDAICETEASTRKESFCDEYGNTAVVLIQIINILQIVVPALVIVLTGIDIGRIVVAGNVEEELPKRKKTIIIRLIIMAVFLFLPLITKLVITLINDKEIYDVSCLFNGGVSTTENNDNECVEIEK